jgi:DNA-binding beta-propeller fold protein YncE
VQRLDLATLLPVGAVRVDPNPGDIVVSADGSRLVVTHFDLQRAVKYATDLDKARATIAVIDAASVGEADAATPTLITTCVAPHGALLDGASGERAIVACYGEDSLAIVDTTSPAADIVRVPLASDVSGFGDPKYGPYALSRSPGGGLVAISNTVSKDVRFYDLDAGAMVDAATIPLQGAPYFAAFDGEDTLVIPTQQPDQIVVADLTGTNAPVVTPLDPSECELPHQIVRDDDGSLWLVCEGDHEAAGTVVHLSGTLETLSVTTVGVYPDSFTFLPEAPR